ncbi:MAG: phosphoribosylamine--glycine ligase [Dehalococcoidia bacterium]|nr:phosphoribosylamine--glycine ligase [Chloroflexota bacterium]MDP5876392.1 phosphoribosylamine--glycine ligase [Dehalococcoidia bacterium]MDP6274276.1 phosphoribosylamine--glycine ligase [Dehalococcoidia bacterium]MDP7160269.1 phosphoribosylamine--glycine ligase [Dehalococcoidia bacterium]
MRVLLVGSGGREHAMADALSKSPLLDQLLIAPGNAGTAELGENVPVAIGDVPGIVALAQGREVDLVIVGPEAPLADGVADDLHSAGIPVFGPTRSAARIESSKNWAKELMARHAIPTAGFAAFRTIEDSVSYINALPEGSVVVKADGLAAGKGVIIAGTRKEANEAVMKMIGDQLFGDAGSTVVIEECMEGPEVSVFAFVDGATVSNEVSACDYKRAHDGDSGPNTGGMGAYTPPEFWTPELAATIRREILEPVAAGMVAEGADFTGILYAGLMLTESGPRVIEFNCRFGDPEAQVVLARLETDLLEIALATANGELDDVDVHWNDQAAVCVVMASGGYPGSYQTGVPITGLSSTPDGVQVYHAGTSTADDGTVITAGGRVLDVVANGADIAKARGTAYDTVSAINFEGAEYRTDIATRAVGSPTV